MCMVTLNLYGSYYFLELYQFIGDNVDLKQKASQQTLDSTGADHHWFHMCAVLDRVDGIDLDTDEPQANITSLPLASNFFAIYRRL